MTTHQTTNGHRFTSGNRFGGIIDISHNNGMIDWVKVPPEYKVVFVKATEGSTFRDPMFVSNCLNAGRTKRMVVPYHMISNKTPGQAQAQFFASAAGLRRGQPAMIDWEAANPQLLPAVSLVEDVVRELSLILGRPPLVYHGIYTLGSPIINACPWHVPKYGPEPDPNKYKWLFWQDTQTAQFPGIPSSVDHDWFNGTEIELGAWYSLGLLPTSIKTP